MEREMTLVTPSRHNRSGKKLVLGINSFFENPAVALLDGDKVLFAAEDERFTGIKHGRAYSPFITYIPFASIYHALKSTGHTFDDVGAVAYSYSKWAHLRSLTGCLTGRRILSLPSELSAFASLWNVPRAFRAGFELPVRYHECISPQSLRRAEFSEWPHHLCHAASAFHCSGWDDALVVVADGIGEDACTSVYVGNGSKLDRVSVHAAPHSLGHFYTAVTIHLGFQPFGDEFKVMGLAAYGTPKYVGVLERILRHHPQGRYSIDLHSLLNLHQHLPGKRTPREPLTDIHSDIAASAQALLERTLVHVIQHQVRATGKKRLCLAGGVFLNCVANGRIATLPEVQDVFVQPAASDAGTALGAAILKAVANGARGPGRTRMDLGTAHDDSVIASILKEANIEHQRLSATELVASLADAISAGKICAIFQGRMEFGPRALGQRSLFASPQSSEMRDRLNLIKGREGFRPVAPIVTAEAFDRYFIGHKDPHMLFTCRTTELAKQCIPSAVHVDGSARVQTISSEDNPFVYSVLRAVEERASHPVILNTSFNVMGKPIVESPREAIACFFTSALDVLAIGDCLLTKTRSASSDTSSLDVSATGTLARVA